MLKNYFRLAINLALYLGMALLVFRATEMLAAPFPAFKRLLDDNPPVLLIASACVIYLLLALLFRIRGSIAKNEPRRLLDAIRFRKLNAGEFAGSLAVGFGCALFFFGLMKLPFLPDRIAYELNNYVDVISKSDAFAFAVLGVGAVGVLFEEFYFRGLIFGELRRALPLPAAFVVHALIYAYFQPSLTISFTAFALALLYSYLYAKTASVWSTVTAAALLNMLIVSAKPSGIFPMLDKANAAVPIVMLVAGAAFVLVGLDRVRRVAGAPAKDGGKLEGIAKAFAWAGVFVAVYYAVLNSIIYVWTGVLTRYEPIRPWLNDSANNLWALVLNDLIAVPIYFFILRRYRSQSLTAYCGFSRLDGRTVARIAALSVSMGLWVMSVAKIPDVENAFPQFDALFNSLVGGPLPSFLVFLILHSVYKEILFRGLVFNAFRSAMPLTAAFALDALVYGALFFQADPALTIYGGMGTVIFGLLYLWYRSLWAPIAAQIGLFATYYAAWHGMSAFDIEFGAAFYVIMAVSSASVLYFMYRLWAKRALPGNARQAAPISYERGAGASI